MAQRRWRPKQLRSKKQFGNSFPFSNRLSTQSFLVHAVGPASKRRKIQIHELGPLDY
jgi:hypothetical protein